ncbi:MAG: cytidine deaminase [Actinomycetota bacterium]|nr:cytidine deaminase [Actinomycetota bacterium]
MPEPKPAPMDPAPMDPAPMDLEDAKLVTLARATRARVGAAQGAAVRDDTGRTYAGAPVALPSLSLTALQVAVAAALSSGAQGLEAAAVVGEPEVLADSDVRLLSELGGPPVVLARPDGTVRDPR